MYYNIVLCSLIGWLDYNEVVKNACQFLFYKQCICELLPDTITAALRCRVHIRGINIIINMAHDIVYHIA